MAVASLRLPPVAIVRWPKFILWSRSQMGIASTDTATRWLARTSTTALRDSGVVELEEEQAGLWAERVANIFRSQDKLSMVRQLKEIMNLDLQYDLTDAVSSFVVAFSVVLSFG